MWMRMQEAKKEGKKEKEISLAGEIYGAGYLDPAPYFHVTAGLK